MWRSELPNSRNAQFLLGFCELRFAPHTKTFTKISEFGSLDLHILNGGVLHSGHHAAIAKACFLEGSTYSIGNRDFQ